MKRERGFTLIEIMVVVVILGILTALAAPKIIDRIIDARIQAAKTDISTLEAAVSYYRMDNYRNPPVEFGLQALVEAPPGNLAPNWRAVCYVKKLPTDPWGNPYLYSIDGSSIDIYTLGADQRPGGDGNDTDVHWQDL
jgi:general secretion pathway protein G